MPFPKQPPVLTDEQVLEEQAKIADRKGDNTKGAP